MVYPFSSAKILRIWPTDFNQIFAKPPKRWSLEFVEPDFWIFVCEGQEIRKTPQKSEKSRFLKIIKVDFIYIYWTFYSPSDGIHNKQKPRTKKNIKISKIFQTSNQAIWKIQTFTNFHYLSILSYTTFHNVFKNQFTEIFRLKSRLYFVHNVCSSDFDKNL